MPEYGSEVRQIAWRDAFPIVRLFRATRMALGPKRMLLGLAAVLLVAFFGGCVLDSLWGQRGAAVVVADWSGRTTELQQYSTLPYHEYAVWVAEMREARHTFATAALLRLNVYTDPDEARVAYQREGFERLVLDAATLEQRKSLVREIDRVVTDAERRIQSDRAVGRAERNRRVNALKQAADTVKRALYLALPPGPAAARELDDAVDLLREQRRVVPPAEGETADAPSADPLADLPAVLRRAAAVAEHRLWKPAGPFRAFLEHEQRSFAAAIQGVANGRLGFSGDAYSERPSMAASLGSAVQGALWLGTQRPWYTLLFGAISLLVFALFGSAICRHVAVQAAREDDEPLGATLRFVGERYSGFVLAPVAPAAVVALAAAVMCIGGFLGAVIPWGIGETLSGILWFLSLIGGLVAALALLVLLFGFPLMWPSIAVEGSDALDSISHATSYLFGRFVNFIVYSLTLLIYGAFSYLLVRLVVLLMLKFSHRLSGLGMNARPAGHLEGTGNLDALWTMPAWADLALLPGTQAAAVWGTFPAGPLGALEQVGQFLIMCWVLLAVGLLGAFAVSYYFTGATLMYFQLRRDVDSTDFEDIYYEETDDPFAPILGSTEPPAAGLAEPPGPVPPPPGTPHEGDLGPEPRT